MNWGCEGELSKFTRILNDHFTSLLVINNQRIRQIHVQSSISPTSETKKCFSFLFNSYQIQFEILFGNLSNKESKCEHVIDQRLSAKCVTSEYSSDRSDLAAHRIHRHLLPSPAVLYRSVSPDSISEYSSTVRIMMVAVRRHIHSESQSHWPGINDGTNFFQIVYDTWLESTVYTDQRFSRWSVNLCVNSRQVLSFLHCSFD